METLCEKRENYTTNSTIINNCVANKKKHFVGSLDILDFGIFLYLFSIVFADGSILFYASSAILLLLFFIKKGLPKINNTFIVLSFLFILYSFFQIVLSIAEYPSTSLSRLLIVLINFVICIVLFNYLDNKANRIKLGYFFVAILILFIVYSVVFYRKDLLTGRFGDNIRYLFGFSGVNGAYMNSNNVGRNFYMGILFAIIAYSSTKKHLLFTVALIAVFLLFLALTGSRGALLVAIGFLVLFFIASAKNALSFLRNLLIVFVVCYLSYTAIMNIDFLYQIIGRRIEALIYGTFNNIDYIGSGDGNSAYFRLHMIKEGLAVFSQRPIFGWGLFAYSQMATTGTYTHSNFVEMLVSGGVVGFIFYYLPLFFLLISSIKKMANYRDNNRLLFSAIFAFLVVKIASNIFDIDYVSRMALLGFYYLASFFTGRKTIEYE